MDLSVADLDAGGEAVDDEAACFGLKEGEELGVGAEIGWGAVDGCGELSCERMRSGKELAGRVAEDEDGRGAEDLLSERGIGEEGSSGGFKERGLSGETFFRGQSCRGLERGSMLDGLAEVSCDAFGEERRRSSRCGQGAQLREEF